MAVDNASTAVEGVIVKVLNYAPRDGRASFVIRVMGRDDKPVDTEASGNLPLPPRQGKSITLFGSWREKFDRRSKKPQEVDVARKPSANDWEFVFHGFAMPPPDTANEAMELVAGVIFSPMLQRGELKGHPAQAHTLAQQLVNGATIRLGSVDALFRTLDREPAKVPLPQGLNDVQRAAALCHWQQFRAPELIKEKLREFPPVKGRSLSSMRNALAYISAVPQQSYPTLCADPYTVFEHGLAPLETIDQYWTESGGESLALPRVRAHLLNAVREETLNGSTMADKYYAIQRASSTLGCGYYDLQAVVQKCVELGHFVETNTHDVEWVTTPTMSSTADGILREITRLKASCRRFAPNSLPDFDGDLSAQQNGFVRHALTNGLTFLVGGPGTGKTRSGGTLLNVAEQLGMHDPVLVAPTGAAAERMTQSTGRQAQTFHRLLQYDKHGQPRYNENNHLPPRLYWADELSMPDDKLFLDFLKALPSNAMLVGMGDPNQLPSVGKGAFFRDLDVHQFAPCYRFTEPHRAAADSAILKAAYSVIDGRMPVLSDIDSDSDFVWVPSLGDKHLMHTITRLTTMWLPTNGFAPERIQVLSPMAETSSGTAELNKILQSVRNPKGPAVSNPAKGTLFRVGDPVIQTANDYRSGVYNGEAGVVTQVDEHKSHVVCNFGSGRICHYWANTLWRLDLAYSVSIHKSQGSEYDAVVVPVTRAHHRMLYRNMLFTAMTRAKKRLILVGEEDALAACVAQSNDGPFRRNTILDARLESLRVQREQSCTTELDNVVALTG